MFNCRNDWIGSHHNLRVLEKNYDQKWIWRQPGWLKCRPHIIHEIPRLRFPLRNCRDWLSPLFLFTFVKSISKFEEHIYDERNWLSGFYVIIQNTSKYLLFLYIPEVSEILMTPFKTQTYLKLLIISSPSWKEFVEWANLIGLTG